MNGERHDHDAIRFDRQQFRELMEVANNLVDLFVAKDQAIIDLLTLKVHKINRALDEALTKETE